MDSNQSWTKEHTVTREEAIAYARATNDENPRYLSGEIAPPMFAVFLEMPALLACLKDGSIIGDPKRFLRLVHGEHDMRYLRPVVPGRTYTTAATLESKVEKSSGEVITLKLVTSDKDGPVVETLTAMFIRSEQKSEAKETKGPPPAPVERALILQANEAVAPDQSLRYADASGDHNPIHKDPAVAAKAGLPGVILHGLCSMAFCQKHLVNQLAKGDPTKLKRLKVRFAKPVLMGQTLAIAAWKQDDMIAFEAKVAADVVLKDGAAQITA